MNGILNSWSVIAKYISVPSGTRSNVSCELLGVELKYESNDTLSYLVKDCIKVFLCHNSAKSSEMTCMTHKFYSDRKLGSLEMDPLYLNDNFLTYIMSKCSIINDDIVKDVLIRMACLQPGKFDCSTITDCISPNKLDNCQRSIILEMVEFICFHFIESKTILNSMLLKILHIGGSLCCCINESLTISAKCKSFPELCNAIIECSLPTFHSFLSLNNQSEEICRLPLLAHSYILEEVKAYCFQKKLLATLFAIFQEDASSARDFIALCDEGLNCASNGKIGMKKIAKNILIASHELTVFKLMSVFILTENIVGKHSLEELLDLVSTTKFDESCHFISIMKKIIYKRLIETRPKELLQLINLNGCSDIVHKSSDIHTKLLCVKSLVKEYGLIILNDLKNNADWILEKDSIIQQTADNFNLLGDSYQSTRYVIQQLFQYCFKYDINLIDNTY